MCYSLFMHISRYLLAHSRASTADILDGWRSKLLTQHPSPLPSGVEIVHARDDFSTRAETLGGWDVWTHDVPRATQEDGTPLFAGVILPITSVEDPVGKATATLLKGFLSQSKPIYAWDVNNHIFCPVESLSRNTGSKDFKAWAFVHFAEPEPAEEEEDLPLGADPRVNALGISILSSLGISEESISGMTAEQAAKIIRNGIKFR